MYNWCFPHAAFIKLLWIKCHIYVPPIVTKFISTSAMSCFVINHRRNKQPSSKLFVILFSKCCNSLIISNKYIIAITTKTRKKYVYTISKCMLQAQIQVYEYWKVLDHFVFQPCELLDKTKALWRRKYDIFGQYWYIRYVPVFYPYWEILQSGIEVYLLPLSLSNYFSHKHD